MINDGDVWDNWECGDKLYILYNNMVTLRRLEKETRYATNMTNSTNLQGQACLGECFLWWLVVLG